MQASVGARLTEAEAKTLANLLGRIIASDESH
jgi:hypothetical protein